MGLFSSVPDVLDRVKSHLGIESDYRLAKVTGLSLNSVSNYRTGRSMPDEKACRALAAAGGLDTDVLIAYMQAQRAHDAEVRAMWERIAARLAGTVTAAIFAVLAAIGLGAPQPALARGVEPQHEPPRAFDLLYIVSIWMLCAAWLWLLASALSDPSFRAPWLP